MLSAHWMLQGSLFRSHWRCCSGSHVLQWILSLQLDMTRCPMTVQLRCVLLWLSGRWRGSTIFSRNVVGTILQRFRSSRLRYGWMGTHVHQDVLGVGLPPVGGLGWRFCVCIWYISTWFFLMHFSIQWSSARVEACFSRVLCPHAGCLDVLPPTEVVQLDVSRLTILGVLHYIKSLNASVGLSL